jgi:hypothetical protein
VCIAFLGKSYILLVIVFGWAKLKIINTDSHLGEVDKDGSTQLS